MRLSAERGNKPPQNGCFLNWLFTYLLHRISLRERRGIRYRQAQGNGEFGFLVERAAGCPRSRRAKPGGRGSSRIRVLFCFPAMALLPLAAPLQWCGIHHDESVISRQLPCLGRCSRFWERNCRRWMNRQVLQKSGRQGVDSSRTMMPAAFSQDIAVFSSAGKWPRPFSGAKDRRDEARMPITGSGAPDLMRTRPGSSRDGGA